MSNFIDLTGKRFGRLTILIRSENDSKKWLCKCDCGNVKEIDGYSLRKGLSKSCGCLSKELLSKNKLDDLINKQFGRLKVIRRIDCQSSKDAKWECVCDCGNIIYAFSNNLKSGHTTSCGCSRNEKYYGNGITGEKFGYLTAECYDYSKRKYKCVCDCGNIVFVSKSNLVFGNTKSCGCFRFEHYEDLTDKRFDKLTVKSFYGRSNYDILWNCECDCGNTTIVGTKNLKSGHTKSCGCLSSKGESEIKKILDKYQIRYNPQQSFKNSPISRLRYDFSILNKNNKVIGLIEYDGIQHFEPTSFHNATYEEKVEELTKITKRDAKKTMFAFENRIPLLRIKYDNKNLEEEILSFMNNHNFWKEIGNRDEGGGLVDV